MKRNIPLLAGSFILGGLGVYLYASRIEAKNWRVETVKVTTYGDAPVSDSAEYVRASPGEIVSSRTYRILHLSDLHLAYPETDKLKFLEKVTSDEYDFVVITGDVFENYTGIQYASDLLSRRPKLGAYAVLGNHDYYDYSYFNKIVGRINKRLRHPDQMRDVTPMVRALQKGGYDVLMNESRNHLEGVHVVGLDYPGIEPQALLELTAQARPGQMILTLFHMPRQLRLIQESKSHLALGGHTHGGQIRVPGFGALITDSELARHEASGLVYRGDTTFHISRGLSADPRSNFRLFCPPVATVLEVTHRLRKPLLRSKAVIGMYA